MTYTSDQIADIKEREVKALEQLKELGLTPAAQVSKINLGNDTFADKLVCYLADTKFTDSVSPIQKEDLT